MDSKAIKPKEKKEAEASAEFTQNGPVFVPSVDIYENKEALTLVADMPGVSSDGVEIHLKDNDLNILGRTKNEEALGSPVHTEYESGDYLRRFTLSSVIDQGKIQATMRDGVLKVVLPKSEAAKPRQISVTPE